MISWTLIICVPR